ncbi:MAG: glycerophosphodiester phosphodiesterase [Ruminococcaceae bacterium]|nr:glycerophosphodiester phosphodiesterase [Oscillospiraceae bacterium]
MSKIIAHRGFSGKYPENTMLAFSKAVEIGADGIELDVHFTKDGEIVIIHDETIDRTTDGTGFVRDYTYEELSKFNAYGRFEGQFEFQKIPTLREYFELVKDVEGFITNIELKTGIFEYEGIEKAVIDLVKEFGLEDRTILSSFNHFTVMRCKEYEPSIKTGFLVESWIIGMGEYTKSHGIDCVHPIFVNLKPELYAEMKNAGREVNTWTVNEYEDIRRLADMGVDALIGNYPDRMTELLR